MAFSYLSRLFKQLKRSRWILIYFSLVIIQTILSIPILVKTLINTENVEAYDATPYDPAFKNTIFDQSLMYKEYKILYENIFFIFYETWRIWILIDGIVHLNSLTILASAWFSVFSCIFNVMLVVESRKWVLAMYDPLKVENMYLHIALTVVFFVLSVPVIISAYKSSQVIGWQVYKRIGSSIELQNMYHNVQWFALLLKIDIFFQVFLLVGVAIISTTRLSIFVFSIIMCLAMPCSMVLSRYAITKESRWMMLIFILFQLIMFSSVVYFLVGLFQFPADDLWFAGIVYGLASVACVFVTIFLAVRCQINFGKGLKPYVEWVPFKEKKNDDVDGTNQTTKAGLLREKTGIAQPIDDDDDEYLSLQDRGLETSKFIYNNTKIKDVEDNPVILRTSLELVDNSTQFKLNTIDLSDARRQQHSPFTVPNNRIALQPTISTLPNYENITAPYPTSSSSPVNTLSSYQSTPQTVSPYITLKKYPF